MQPRPTLIAALAGLLAAAPALAEEPLASVESTAPDFRRTDVLFWTTMTLSALHHTDHVIRDNHSGFPFRSHVTPLTPSLAVYPLYFGGKYFDMGPLYWTLLDSASLALVLWVHTTAEPPRDLYDPWVDGSNRLGIESAPIGRAAQVVTLGLAASITGHLISSILDGVEHGFTWRRGPSGGNAPLVTAVPAHGGASLVLGFDF